MFNKRFLGCFGLSLFVLPARGFRRVGRHEIASLYGFPRLVDCVHWSQPSRLRGRRHRRGCWPSEAGSAMLLRMHDDDVCEEDGGDGDDGGGGGDDNAYAAAVLVLLLHRRHHPRALGMTLLVMVGFVVVSSILIEDGHV